MAQRKHKKLKASHPHEEIIRSDSSNYLLKLPPELLGEILLYTKSPRDVLALSRTCKFFCRTLLHESNQYIWRYARQNCLPRPLPEPCSQFTESSFAAFVFDAGPCEICTSRVDFFTSFGIRLRLCTNSACKKQLQNTSAENKQYLQYSPSIDIYKIFENTLPVIENSGCLAASDYANTNWPGILSVFRFSDWSLALQDYLDASIDPEKLEEYTNNCVLKLAPNTEYMQMCVALHDWKTRYLAAQETNKKVNLQFSKKLASQEGLDLWDLMNTSTYSSLLKSKNLSLEEIQRSDYNLRETAIAQELRKVAEGRSRRSHEEKYAAARRAVEKHYNRLRTSKRALPLPCLPTFRQLPTIHQHQQSSQSEKALDKILQSEPIETLIHSELETFRLQSRNSLGEILGFPDWKQPSSNKIHPVDRLTARFRCRTCGRVEAKYKELGCMDYEGAIMHMCATTMDKPTRQNPFKASRFEPDTKAIAAMSTLLETCGIAGDEKGSHELLSEIGPRVLCSSCEAPVVMEPRAVIGHARRHETTPSLILLPPDEAKETLGEYPLTHGLATKLMNPGPVATKMRNMKVYMCRHCFQRRPESCTVPPTEATSDAATNCEGPAATTPAPNTSNATSSTPALPTTSSSKTVAKGQAAKRKQTLFTFDGLRSHLKDVHKANPLGDEDFICSQELEWPKR